MKKLFSLLTLSLIAFVTFAQVNIPRPQNFMQAVSISGDISITISADQNNWAPSGFNAASVIRLTCGSGDTITGLAAGTDGRIITIVNVGSNTATIIGESSASTAANRFKFVTGNCRIPVNGSATFIYDATTSRWRLLDAPVQNSTYKVLLTQSSTSAPSAATTLVNNVGYTLTWARSNTGIYTLTISGYTAGKIYVNSAEWIVSTTQVSVNISHGVSGSDYVITVKTFSNGTLADGVFTTTPFELEIYP
jgi:hypothetical protein